MAFKMKGSPFQRNFGIGDSPLTSNGGIYDEPTKKESRKMKKAIKKFEKAEKWAKKGNLSKAEKKWKKGMKKHDQAIEASNDAGSTYVGSKEDQYALGKTQERAIHAIDDANRKSK